MTTIFETYLQGQRWEEVQGWTYHVCPPFRRWQFWHLWDDDLCRCRRVQSESWKCVKLFISLLNGRLKFELSKEFLNWAFYKSFHHQSDSWSIFNDFTSFSKLEIWSHNRRFSRRECNKSASARSNLWRNELFSAFKREISALPWRSERSNCILELEN